VLGQKIAAGEATVVLKLERQPSAAGLMREFGSATSTYLVAIKAQQI
jgi:hypothetical protein